MALISIQIKNADKIISAFARAPQKMARGIQNALERTGVYVTGKTKEHITAGTEMWKPPIDTGAMRRGINMSSRQMKVVVKPSEMTEYARYVHEGTSRMIGRPFFDITAKREKNSIKKFFEDELKDTLKNILK